MTDVNIYSGCRRECTCKLILYVCDRPVQKLVLMVADIYNNENGLIRLTKYNASKLAAKQGLYERTYVKAPLYFKDSYGRLKWSLIMYLTKSLCDASCIISSILNCLLNDFCQDMKWRVKRKNYTVTRFWQTFVLFLLDYILTKIVGSHSIVPSTVVYRTI